MSKQARKHTYEVRNKAWEVFGAKYDFGLASPAIRLAMRDAFNAGWAARKAAQYYVENRTRAVRAVDHYLFVTDPNKD
jgi:hypothetical protein